MKALTKYTYGGPEVLHLEDIKKPQVSENHLLVRIKANSANPADWHILRGKPFFARFAFGLFKPKEPVLGADFAGVVEEVGSGVTTFAIGDHVYGETINGGAFAEYACIPQSVCGHIPDGIGFTEMACMPIAGLTALQALVTHGKLKEGESVLINGASGGVGHFAIQIAKAYGVKVTGVCSDRNVDFVSSLGADHVVAYDKVDIHTFQESFDLVIDTHGNLKFSDYKRMGKRGVLVGFTSMSQLMFVMLKKGFSKYPLTQFTAEANTADLHTLAQLVIDGKVKPHIEKSYPYREIPEAISHIESMRTRGKVAMTWEV